jgi:Zn-dependent metalloprotease
VGQQQAARPALQSVGASSGALAQWSTRVDAMLRDGTLDFDRVQSDTMIAGRTHERLGQRHENLPVFGGQLIRQMNGRSVLSVFGQFFENVSVPTVAASIDADRAAEIAERAAGEGASAGGPVLGILPKDDAYVLVYRTKVRSPWDIRTYFVNARTGEVERTLSEIKHQQDIPTVGLGTGVLGDRKKVSASQSSGTFRAIDLKRPADAFTLDFGGSVTRLNNFLTTGAVFLSDVATSQNADWTDAASVDAHTYEGWVYDFYF